ncbi:MAG: hypothetical protein ABIO40_09525 [Devosia sp.]
MLRSRHSTAVNLACFAAAAQLIVALMIWRVDQAIALIATLFGLLLALAAHQIRSGRWTLRWPFLRQK